MKKYAVLVFFILICATAHAQNNGAYLVPRRIYIGDPAVLVLPLPPDNSLRSQNIVLTPLSPDFPSHADIDFHRITLERRAGGSRLMIEFTAFVPGILELPIIEIEGERFPGLTVTVNSMVDSRSSVVLSGPASSLAMPGTALMLYGTMAVVIVFILFAIWFIFRGRTFMQKLGEKWKLWKSFVSMKSIEKHLRRSVLRGGNKRLILDKLSDEFRLFLSFLSGHNCRAMTAREFQQLPFELLNHHEIDPSFLLDFFSRCDKLRFSGININTKEVLQLLVDMRGFIGALEKAKKARTGHKEASAA
jgi:hypothetical protein